MDHTQCGGQDNKVEPGKNVTIPCEGWGSHVSMRKYGGPKRYMLLFCEVFVIGYKYIGKISACSSATKLSDLQLHNYINYISTV